MPSKSPVIPASSLSSTRQSTASSASRDLFLGFLACLVCANIVFYKSAPPLRGAVVRGTRQHAPRRLMGGASSAFLAARGARGGSSCYCCSACAECSGLGCRTASAALRVAGGAGCVTTTRRLTISKTLQQTCVLGHYVV